jgi:transcriptional regulator with PAS, ATPase and Fis domain
MIGTSPPIKKSSRTSTKSPDEGERALTGESGTAKEPVSRAVHRLSPRKEGLFVK